MCKNRLRLKTIKTSEMKLFTKKTKTSYKALFLIAFLSLNTSIALSQSQQGSHKYTLNKLEQYTDSLKRTPYPYILPFLGKQAQEKGFDIQRPFGIMVTIGQAENELTIDRLAVSTDNITYTDVSDIVNFTKVNPKTEIMSIRPDVWVLPFLNISGLAGYYKSETEVAMDQPADMKFLATSEGNLYGFGILAAGGVGPLFASYQFNGTWSYSDKLFEPTFTSLHGIRIGHQRKHSKRPQTALTVWVGAESMTMSEHSRGSLNLTEMMGMTEEEQQNASEQLDSWYNELPPIRQELLEPIYENLSGMLNDGEDALFYYDFDKSVVQKWNMLAGFQYQINKNIAIGGEGSFIGSRWRAIFTTVYRFGINKK